VALGGGGGGEDCCEPPQDEIGTSDANTYVITELVVSCAFRMILPTSGHIFPGRNYDSNDPNMPVPHTQLRPTTNPTGGYGSAGDGRTTVKGKYRRQSAQNSTFEGFRLTHNFQPIKKMLVKVINQHNVAGHRAIL
jgi:hypothetical protein